MKATNCGVVLLFVLLIEGLATAALAQSDELETFAFRSCAERSHCGECLHDTRCLFCLTPGSNSNGRCVPRSKSFKALCMFEHGLVANAASENQTNAGPVFERMCPTRPLDRALTTSLMSLLSVTMLGMGATVSWHDIRLVFKAPISLAAGLIAQYLLFPFVCILLIVIFDLPNSVAVGLLLLSLTPSGAMSQLWTYFTDGDVALSIILTFCTTAFSFVTLPLFGYSLTRPFMRGTMAIDFAQIGLSMLALVIPIVIGITTKTYTPRIAFYLEKIGVVVGILTILLAIVLGSIAHFHIYRSNWKIWVVSTTLPVIGMVLGYALARITKLPPRHRRTIGWETGVQNSALTIALITAAFQQPHASAALAIPLIYSTFVFVDGAIMVALYRGWLRKRWPDNEPPHKGTNDESGDDAANLAMEILPKTRPQPKHLEKRASSKESSDEGYRSADDDEQRSGDQKRNGSATRAQQAGRSQSTSSPETDQHQATREYFSEGEQSKITR